MIKIFNIVITTKTEMNLILERIFKIELEKKQNTIALLTAEKSQIKKSRYKWRQKYFNIKKKLG